MSTNFHYLELSIVLLFYVFFCINLKKISKTIRIFDEPDKRLKRHNKSVFIGGGILFFLSFLLIYLLNILFYEEYILKISTLVSASLIFLLGLVDDKYRLNYKTKFFLLATILFFYVNLNENIAINNFQFSFSTLNFSLGSYSVLFTVACFLIFMNAVNLFDGINLQSGFYFLIIFILFYLISKNNIFLYLTLSSIVFLFLNYKNYIFLGDGGSLFISFLIAFFSISFYKNNFLESDEVILLMIVPGLDMFRLFIERIVNKKNPFKGDLDHLHHLIKKNFNYIFAVIVNSFFTIVIVILRFVFDVNSLFILIFFITTYIIILTIVRGKKKT